MAKYWSYHRPLSIGCYPDRYSGHEDPICVTNWHPNNPQVTLWTGARIQPYGEIEYADPIPLEEAIHFSLIPQDEHECACYLALDAARGKMGEYARRMLDYQKRGIEALREEIAAGWAKSNAVFYLRQIPAADLHRFWAGWANRDAVFYLQLVEDFEEMKKEA